MKPPWVLIAALGIAVSPGDALSADEDPCDSGAGMASEARLEFAFRPDTSIEYLDLSSAWRRLLDLPGSYRSGPQLRVLPPGGSDVFKARLMTAETARLNAREFRLLLRTYNPRLCVFSVPFYGVPPRAPVLQLQSVGSRSP
jgi:hypothetical protein